MLDCILSVVFSYISYSSGSIVSPFYKLLHNVFVIIFLFCIFKPLVPHFLSTPLKICEKASDRLKHVESNNIVSFSLLIVCFPL